VRDVLVSRAASVPVFTYLEWQAPGHAFEASGTPRFAIIKALHEYEGHRTHRRYRRTTSTAGERTDEFSAGPVRLIVLLSEEEEDDAGAAWAHGVAWEWADELSDPRQDIYTLTDGQPVDSAR